MGIAVGIDMGTSTSMIAVYDGSGRRFPLMETRWAVPSVVAYLDGGTAVVGPRAQRRGARAVAATVHSAKRWLGRGYTEVTGSTGPAPPGVVATAGDAARFDGDGLPVTPEEVSAEVLRALADDLAQRLGEPVAEVVLTVPALFGDRQRRAAREAARLAGLDVIRIMNEPAAAALAYSIGRSGRETVMIFDLGGGTLDVAVVDIGFGIVEVRAVAGDAGLGGDDVDRAIAEHLAEETAAGTGCDPRRDRRLWRRLVEAAERAKVRLSSADRTRVSVPLDAARGGGRFAATLTRDTVERLSADLVERCRRAADRALRDANATADDLDEILVMGRAARMPAVRAMLRTLTGGRLPRAALDPDGMVAGGAAIQAAALHGAVCDALVWDVTPVALAARTPDGRRTPIVRRNTATPVTHTVVVPGAGVVLIEEDDDRDRILGRVDLGPAVTATAGHAVMFHVDADGILSASAVDPDTGAERAVPILAADGSGGLAPRAPATAGRASELLVLGRTEA